MALFAFDACFKMNLKLSLRRIGKVEIFCEIKGRYAALEKALTFDVTADIVFFYFYKF